MSARGHFARCPSQHMLHSTTLSDRGEGVAPGEGRRVLAARVHEMPYSEGSRVSAPELKCSSMYKIKNILNFLEQILLNVLHTRKFP